MNRYEADVDFRPSESGPWIHIHDFTMFVQRMKALAEGMEHIEGCARNLCGVCGEPFMSTCHYRSHVMFEHQVERCDECTCTRGQLLALCEEVSMSDASPEASAKRLRNSASRLEREVEALRAQLAEARAFVEKSGHLPACRAIRCQVVSSGRMCLHEKFQHISVAHDFQPGTCDCDYEKVMGGK